MSRNDITHAGTKLYYWIPDSGILVTHAGVTGFNTIMEVKKHLKKCVKFGLKNNNLAFDIPYSRGGCSDVPGFLWNDFLLNHVGVPGLTQIVGHTESACLTGIIFDETTNTYNLVVDTTNNSVKVLK